MNNSVVLPTLEHPCDTAPQLQPLPSSQIVLPQNQTPPNSRPRSGAWSVFSSTFLTVFLAEMGDKTQLATLLMVAQSQSPWVVFAGSATALIATSVVGVLLGQWLANKLSPKTLQSLAGTTLLFISLMLLWDVAHL